MFNFWNRWKKPWTKEQCRQRYTQGPTISLRQLATDSGRSKATVERWSVQGSWESARGQVEGKLRAKTEQKFVEKVSENISDDLAQVETYHFQSHHVFLEIALTVGQYWLDKIRANPDAIDSINLKAVALASVVVDRAIAGERVAAALHYQDLNKAVEALHKHGYLVVDPSRTQRGAPLN